MIGLPVQIQIDVQPDLRVLLFTAGIAVLTGVLFRLAPAWNAFASAQITRLRDAGVVGERRSRRVLSRGLVVAQVALSVVMLSAGTLLAAHVSNLRSLNLGFQRDWCCCRARPVSKRLRASAAVEPVSRSPDQTGRDSRRSRSTLSGMTPIWRRWQPFRQRRWRL